MSRFLFSLVGLICLGLTVSELRADDPPKGFVSLFNGKNLDGWKVPKGDNGHWKVVDGVIDYDARSEAKGDRSLWTKKTYKNFVLRVDWKLKKLPGLKHGIPIINKDGSYKLDENGKRVTVEINDVDSGIYVRGSSKSQVNIWLWPIGSGEVWGYRNDKRLTPEQRAAVTPMVKADNPHGEWNTYEITMKGDRLSVKLNGKQVLKNAQLPGVPKSGPIALQHHGAWNAKQKRWTSPPSLVQFRNIFIKELK